LYRPACSDCQACIASRVLVDQFNPNRSHRRCLTENEDLQIQNNDVTDVIDHPEYHALYRQYLQSRHPDGTMNQTSQEDFLHFLASPWGQTRFICFRLKQKLVAVAVTDFTSAGLSSVYTFYSPEFLNRGLGIYAVLTQIRMTFDLGLRHLYLGYWIENHPKMGYKINFQPLEFFIRNQWQKLPIQTAQ
jgi:arginyl-tRNA--protein-N-Asp/Glu arginylyltransferase